MTDVDNLINDLKNDKEFKKELRWGYLPFKLKFLVAIFIIALIVEFAFSYREQKFVCNLEKRTCDAYRTTYFGFKDNNKLMDPYIVNDVIYERQFSSRRSFRRKYNIYFVDAKYNRRCVFRDITSREKAKKIVDDIKHAFKNSKNIIEYKL